MRFLFIVQGEGRGHMTQAIALSSLLRNHGHEVTRVIVGRSERRIIPDYFKEQIEAQIEEVDSPNFVTDRNSKSVRIFKSLFHAMARLDTYKRSIGTIDKIVKADDPDVIINFYDFIGGLYNKLKSPRAKFFCIAHQYLSKHSAFEFPAGRLLDKQSLILANWITSLGADAQLALSFYELQDEPGIAVVPPLLRAEIKHMRPTNKEHILVYMLNHGYAEAVNDFHANSPEVKLHCFWDKPDAPIEMKVDENLTYHQLDGQLFLEKMASCKGYLTTAGFESVCEAMYFGKPVMMMPVQGHYEQACNALDAEKAGAGVASDSFDLDILMDYIPKHTSVHSKFKAWTEKTEVRFLKILTA
ncbi:MAG: glycosyltransferase family protein [Cyclobacteriaceae bacterium]